MVKEVKDKTIVASVKQANGSSAIQEIPYGLLVWATGNAPRPLVKDLIEKIPAQSGSRRGLLVNDFLVVEGTEGMWYVPIHPYGVESLGRSVIVLQQNLRPQLKSQPNKELILLDYSIQWPIPMPWKLKSRP